MSSGNKIIKPKPLYLRGAKKVPNNDQQSESKKNDCSMDCNIFLEIESKINSQIDILISKLESIRVERINELSRIREIFTRLESQFEEKKSELSHFITQNCYIDTKRNTLIDMQNDHIATLKRKMDLYGEGRPLPPYIGFSCESNRILGILDRIKLITYSPNDELVSITEERINDWKGMPEQVAFDTRTGEVYYSDLECVRSYNMQGEYTGEVGLWSSKMKAPNGIAILGNELYVADLGLKNISKFSLSLSDSEVPLDFKVSNGIIYMMLDSEIVWVEEPTNSIKNFEESIDLEYKVSYNRINIGRPSSNHRFCLDELGNIVRTEENGQLVINAPDGTEILRRSFTDEDGAVNLTGVCITDKGWIVVGVDNREYILHNLKTNTPTIANRLRICMI